MKTDANEYARKHGIDALRARIDEAIPAAEHEPPPPNGPGDYGARQQHSPKTAPPRPQWIDMSGWDSEPVPSRDWFIRSRIPMRQPTLFSGEGAVGKSLLTLHLLTATALARDWCGFMPEPGGAWYIGAEDDEKELRIRLSGILQHFRASYAELAASGFQMLSLYGDNAVLGAATRSGIIEPTALFQQIYDQAGDTKPKVIALDASADVFAGNEIDRSQVRQFVGLLRKLTNVTHGALLLLAHPSLTGINTGSGLSGSTAWHNSVRARMYLTSPKPEAGEQPDSDVRELTFKKANYSDIGESVVLRWRDGLFLPVAGASSLEKAAREAAADTVFLDLLKRFNGQGRYVNDRTGHAYAPALFAQEPEAKAAKLKRIDMASAMARLFTAKRIKIEQFGRPSRPSYRIIPA